MRRWEPGNKVWMRKSPDEPFEYCMTVVEFEYDNVRGGWNYIVKTQNDEIYGRSVEEPDLKQAS